MKAFGRDELKGRQDKPLKKFRGMFAWKQSINDEIYDDESLKKAEKISDRDSIWSAVGIQKL